MNNKKLPTEWDKVFMNVGAVIVVMAVCAITYLDLAS